MCSSNETSIISEQYIHDAECDHSTEKLEKPYDSMSFEQKPLILDNVMKDWEANHLKVDMHANTTDVISPSVEEVDKSYDENTRDIWRVLAVDDTLNMDDEQSGSSHINNLNKTLSISEELTYDYDTDEEESDNKSTYSDYNTHVRQLDELDDDDSNLPQPECLRNSLSNSNYHLNNSIYRLPFDNSIPSMPSSDSDSDFDYTPNKDDNNDSNSIVNSDEENFCPDNSANLSDNLNISFKAGSIDDMTMHVKSKDEEKCKKNFCFYCKKLQTNISRHITLHANNNPEVAELCTFSKGSDERKRRLEVIRLKGNDLYNRCPEYNQGGQLIVARRPRERQQGTLYQVCHNCNKTLCRSSIRRHFHQCLWMTSKHSRMNTVCSRAVAGRLHCKASMQLRKVLSVMRDDGPARLIRYDETLILFGNELCDKYRRQKQYEMIRSRLKLLGKLLQEMKSKNDEIKEFSSIFRPKYYDEFISAVKVLAGFDDDTGCCKILYRVTTLGTYIKIIGEFLIYEYIKRENVENKKLVKDYLHMHKVTYSNKINRVAVECQVTYNRQNKKRVPTTSDIKKLHVYLENKWSGAYNSLQNSFSLDAWVELSKVTMIQILLFNRKRVGEIEELQWNDLKIMYKNDGNSCPQKYNDFAANVQERIEQYIRIEILGKLNRIVPVLLSTQMQKSIDIILKYRNAAKIRSENPYMFAKPGFTPIGYKHFRAYILLREFADECGADDPESLRGTNLRKHMATECAKQNIDEGKIYDVSNFMGHNEEIHRRHYRQTVAARDICGVSQILESALGIENANNENNCESSVSRNVMNGNESNSENNCESSASRIVINGNESNSDEDLNNDNGDYVVSGNTKKKNGAKNPKHRWSEEEKKAAQLAFGKNIEHAIPVSGQDIGNFLRINSFVKRTVPQIRTWISNQIKFRKLR